MVFTRRRERKKSLREEVLTSKNKLLHISNITNNSHASSRYGDEDDVPVNLDLNLKDKERQTATGLGLDLGLGDMNSEANIFLSNPASCKGSFLRNKLENPLFGNGDEHDHDDEHNYRIKRKQSRSKLDIVVNAKDRDREEEHDRDDESEYDSGLDVSDMEEKEHDRDLENLSELEEEREDSRFEPEARKPRKSRILNLTRYTKALNLSDDKSVVSRTKPRRKSKTVRSKSIIKKTKSKKESKPRKAVRKKSSYALNVYPKYILDTASKTYKRGFLGGRSKKKAEDLEYANERLMRQEKNSSLSSSNSNNSENSDSHGTSESDVDLLTKYEDRSNDINNKKEGGFKLYTENGSSVIVHFNFDYLQINDKICFYEDLASWTNDSKCLRLIYVKNKNTPEQERVEIKLYVVDKEYQGKVTPYDLNELLRKKIAILICDKLQVSMAEAMEMTKKEATDKEINFINEQIDISTEHCMAKSYTKDL